MHQKKFFFMAIFAQWFSRGAFLKVCLNSEFKLILIAGMVCGLLVGPVIQGAISDRIPRKKAILIGQICTLVSVAIAGYMVLQGVENYTATLPFVMALAINSFLSNISPACSATMVDRGMKGMEALMSSNFCRYSGLFAAMAIPFLDAQVFGLALLFNALAFAIVYWKVSSESLPQNT